MVIIWGSPFVEETVAGSGLELAWAAVVTGCTSPESLVTEGGSIKPVLDSRALGGS